MKVVLVEQEGREIAEFYAPDVVIRGPDKDGFYEATTPLNVHRAVSRSSSAAFAFVLQEMAAAILRESKLDNVNE